MVDANKNTFEIPPIKKLLSEDIDLDNHQIDLFVNKNRMVNVINDLNKKHSTDYHTGELDFYACLMMSM